MIIDTPKVVDILAGVGPTIIQPGDSQLQVPAVAVLNIPLIGGTKPVASASTTPQLESFYTATGDIRTNAASNLITICVFRPGYWEIDFNWVIAVNMAAVATTVENFLRFDTPSTVNTQVAAIVQNHALVASFIIQRKFDILFRVNTTFSMRLGITGVGESIHSQIAVTANKRL